MKRSRFSSGVRAVAAGMIALVLQACASTTIIQSQPNGAKLYLNGEPVGNTPYTMTDTKMVGSITTVRLELPGYEPTTTAISRNEEFEVGACIGGVLVLVPFLWIFGYKPVHVFELRPGGGAPPPGWTAPPPGYAPPPPGYQPPPPTYQPPAPTYQPAPQPH
jgi:hypothetical protein